MLNARNIKKTKEKPRYPKKKINLQLAKNITVPNNTQLLNENVPNIENEENYKNSISNELVSQSLANDIINSPNIMQDEIEMKNKDGISIQELALLKTLMQYNHIRDSILNQIKPKNKLLRKKARISFSWYNHQLYEQPFYFHYKNNKIAIILGISQLQYHFRTKRKERKNSLPSQSLKITKNEDISQIKLDKNLLKTTISSSASKNTNLNKKTNMPRMNNPLPDKEDPSQIMKTEGNVNLKGKNITPFILGNDSPKKKITKGNVLTTNENNNNNNTTTTNIRLNSSTTTNPNDISKRSIQQSVSSIVLTKIPEKIAQKEKNLQIDLAYSKAKDAARVVRRMEYAYNMKINLIYSKPIYRRNSKIIQKWWRNLNFFNKNKFHINLIQKYIRGHLSRKAYKQSLRIYKYIMPFLSEIDKILSRILCEFAFDALISEFAMNKIHKIAKENNDKIIKKLRKYLNMMKSLRSNGQLSKKFLHKCLFTKNSICIDNKTKEAIDKIQSKVKSFLMHSNEKTMRKYGDEYNPYLYYKLKYPNNDNVYKRKIDNFRKCVNKFKELNLKVNKGLPTKFDYLNYVIKRKHWKYFKQLYKNKLIEKDKPLAQKRAIQNILINEDKKLLKKYFDKWKHISKPYQKYVKTGIIDKLKIIDLIMKYHKKFDEKIFLMKLENIKNSQDENKKINTKANNLRSFKPLNERDNQEENKADSDSQEGNIVYTKVKNIIDFKMNSKEDSSEKNKKKYLNNMVNLYDKFHCNERNNNILNKYFQIWKKKNFEKNLINKANILNKAFREFLDKKHKNKENKTKALLSIYSRDIRDKLRNWRFENIKFKIEAKRFYKLAAKKVLGLKRRKSLIMNLNNLQKRKEKMKRKAFKKYKVGTGMDYRTCIYSNIQISFFHRRRKFFSLIKYRMLKYMINKLNNEKRIDHWDRILMQKIMHWRSSGRYVKFYEMLKDRIFKLEKENKKVLKVKMIKWIREMKLYKIIWAVLFIQVKFHSFLRRKNLALSK